jgi:hypothetical protein
LKRVWLVVAVALWSDLASAQGAPRAVDVSDAAAAAIELLAAEPFDGEITLPVIGRVLDPLPLVQSFLAREIARATEAAAEREQVRVSRLAAGAQNASARELEAARLAAMRARSDRSDADARVVASWGPSFALRPDLGAFVDRLARGEAALLRLDLGSGAPARSLGDIRIRVPSQGNAERTARLIGPAPSMDPTLQGRGVLVALDSDPPPIGAAVEGRVSLGHASPGSVRIPTRSIVWHDGSSQVFLTPTSNRFLRRAVELEARLPDGSWIASGISPGQRVVGQGAQQLLSAEQLAPADGE